MSSPKNARSGAKLALAALLCAALPAHAADRTTLRPMLDVEQGYDSNIFNESNNGSGSDQGSLITRISPGIWIENEGELGNARLGLTAISRTMWEESQMSGIDGLARGDFDRKLTPRLSVFGDGYLEHYSGYQQITAGGPSQGQDILLGEQPAWDRDRVHGGFSYLLTERLSLRLSGSTGRVNYEKVSDPGSDRGYYRDQTLYSGQSMLLYQLSPLDQVSIGVDLDDTSYQDLGLGTNDSEIWTSYVGWTRNWTQAWSTKATLGFSSLDTKQKGVPQSGGYAYVATCQIFGILFPCPQQGVVPLGQQSFSNTGTGLIGSLSIQRTFARSSLQLSYDRDTRSTGGSGRTNFDIDSFTLSWTQRLAERVKLTLSGNYSLYKSVTDEIPDYAARVTAFSNGTLATSCYLGGAATNVGSIANPTSPGETVPIFQCVGGSSTEDRKYTTLVGRLEWQMRRKLSAYVVARYYKSTTDQSLGSGQDIQTEDLDKFTIGAGFHYYWDLGL